MLEPDIVAGRQGATVDKAKVAKSAAAAVAVKKGIKVVVVLAVLAAVGKVLAGRGG